MMNGVSAYKDTSITTQNKGRLIVMLYEGAIKFMKLAIERINAVDHEAKSRYINKALNIIHELNAILDTDAGGEVAANLRRLYLFMNKHLSEAGMKNDPQMIREVISLMEELNQGWKAITS